jgi:hypothetical protein
MQSQGDVRVVFQGSLAARPKGVLPHARGYQIERRIRRKMPNFPTQIVGTPTNRGKARGCKAAFRARTHLRAIIGGAECGSGKKAS